MWRPQFSSWFSLFNDGPTQTIVLQHDINVTDARSIKQHGNCINAVYTIKKRKQSVSYSMVSQCSAALGKLSILFQCKIRRTPSVHYCHISQCQNCPYLASFTAHGTLSAPEPSRISWCQQVPLAGENRSGRSSELFSTSYSTSTKSNIQLSKQKHFLVAL